MRSILLSLFAISILACERDELTLEEENSNNSALKEIIQYVGVPADSIPADGISHANIMVQVYRHTETMFRSLSFETSIGTFTNDEDKIDTEINAEGVGKAQLRSTIPGKAMIRTSVRNIAVDTNVIFKTALATDLILMADNYTPSTSDPVIITASLFRSIGTVTNGVRVNISAIAENMNSLELVFPPFVTTTNGEATFTITNPFEVKGWVIVTASTTSIDGKLLSRTLRFRFD